MSDDALQLHPEAQRLTGENSRLREELARLLTEVEDLLCTVKPNLLALYQTKLGTWELRRLEAQVRVARWRRQIELAQASLNRGGRPDPVAIGAALELAFRGWQIEVQETAERIRAAETRLSHLLSPAEDRELRSLYRALVKRMHPDLNPVLTDGQRQLWRRVQAAYLAGDLVELRALDLVAQDATAVSPPPKALEELRRERTMLQAQITALLKRLEEIQSEPPFTLRGQLDDLDWLAARRQAIEAETEALRQQAAVLEAHWEACLQPSCDGTVFGQN